MSTGSDALLEVEGLTIGFGGEPLLEDVAFQVDRGEVFVILGPSGSGKSTLMYHLIGLQRPQAGRIRIEGREPELNLDRPPAYGVMFESGSLLGSMTLAENLALPLAAWTSLEDRAIQVIVRAKLRLVELEGAEDRLPSELSGGMRKRAAIARALMLEPRLLFLDEPSAGLDPPTALELDELILTLNRDVGTTLVIVTHELASVFKVADRCIMLDPEHRGILAEGDPRRLRDESQDPKVHAFFNRTRTPEEGS